jgi:hypothetical protein
MGDECDGDGYDGDEGEVISKQTVEIRHDNLVEVLSLSPQI